MWKKIAAYSADAAKTTRFDKGLNVSKYAVLLLKDNEEFVIRWEPMKDHGPKKVVILQT